jgi:hypothetical protein
MDGGLDDDISGEDPAARFEDVFDESRTLHNWLDPQGRKQPFAVIRFTEDEVAASGAAVDRRYTQQIREATGNEGASMDRWYRQAVVVLWPPSRFFSILADEGPRQAVPALEAMVAAAAEPANDTACRQFATEIIARWNAAEADHRWSTPADMDDDLEDDDLEHGDTALKNDGDQADWADADIPAWATRGTWSLSSEEPAPPALSTRMLEVLDRIGDVALAARLVHDVLPHDAEAAAGSILVRLANRWGWPPLTEPLRHYFATQRPVSYSMKLDTPVAIYQALCCDPPAMNDDRRAACVWAADAVDRMLARWDRRHAKGNSPYLRELSAGIVASIVQSFAAVGAIDRLTTYIDRILRLPERYPARRMLVDAVKTLHAALPSDSPARPGVERLREHCLTVLRAATAQPIVPPADWTRDAPVDCTCADCRELVQFLRDPVAQVHRFARRQALRSHLEQAVRAHRLDVDCRTLERGSPKTLICTKTQASYDRRRRRFDKDQQAVRELESLADAPPAATSGTAKRVKSSRARSR